MFVHWHRNDLRVSDNHALAKAIERGGSVLPVFVLDPDVLSYASSVRVAFLLDALDALRADYRALGGDLLIVEGEPRAELSRIAARSDVEGVCWNRDYTGLARDRDATVADALEALGVDHASFEDALLHPPGSITTNAGDPYAVFSYFYRKWADRAKPDPLDPPATGTIATPAEAAPTPTLEELGFDPPSAAIPPAGTDAARERLERFCDGPIYRYAAERDVPAREGTSRLSAHLRFGTIGIREVWEATDRADADASSGEARDAVEAFQRQLAWREFYSHVLADRPDVVAHDYRPFEVGVAWRDDPGGLRAWKDGQTGYPIVDAGMRQLRAEGWMHNRARMIVASFLTKDLLIDWRAGYRWFRERLVDHDPANDSGGWQWAAGTGTDAQPYFRIFNPTTQGKRFDPDATFVKTHVPELSDVDPQTIHRWPDLDDQERDRINVDYPHPIVDHAAARERALDAFRRARGET